MRADANPFIVGQVRRARQAGAVRRRRRAPRPTPATSIQLDYLRDIAAVVKGAERYIWDALRPLQGTFRRDDDRVNSALDRASEAFFKALRQEQIEVMARESARKVARLTKENLARQARAQLGVDIFQAEPRLEALVPGYVSENVALIKSVPNRLFDEVERLAANALREGRRWEDLARDIQARTGVAEDRARLIARDQVGKLVGQVADARHAALGVTHFFWRTVRDNRVREEHEALDGDRFEVGVGDSEEGLPGQAVNCRCYQDPDFSGILGAAE